MASFFTVPKYTVSKSSTVTRTVSCFFFCCFSSSVVFIFQHSFLADLMFPTCSCSFGDIFKISDPREGQRPLSLSPSFTKHCAVVSRKVAATVPCDMSSSDKTEMSLTHPKSIFTNPGTEIKRNTRPLAMETPYIVPYKFIFINNESFLKVEMLGYST